MRRALPVPLLVGVLACALAPACGGGGGGGPVPTVTLDRVEPSSAFTPGGASLVVRGSGFLTGGSDPWAVTIGGTASPGGTPATDTGLTCTAPPGAAGPADVVATRGAESASLPGGFTYYGYPPSFRAAETRLDTDPVGSAVSSGARVCCSGPRRYIAWSDDRNGGRDVYFNRSTDGGTTWLAADVRLDTDGVGTASSNLPRVSCDGPDVFVVWYDSRNGAFDVYGNHSTDGGATWGASDVRLNSDTAGANSTLAPEMARCGASVYVTWMDDRNGGFDVFVRRSEDGGATWPEAEFRVDTDVPGADDSLLPKICCSGSLVCVAWGDYRRGGPLDVYFNRSANGGDDWLAADVRLDTDTLGSGSSDHVSICCDAPNVFVVWHEPRSGLTDVFANVSADRGTTWLATDVRLNTDAAGAAHARGPAVCCTGAEAAVVWSDSRHGSSDVLFTTTRP